MTNHLCPECGKATYDHGGNEIYKCFDAMLYKGMSPTWQHVLSFALKMEHKLAQRRDYGDRPGWLAKGAQELQSWIKDEVEELAEARQNGSVSDVWDEAADVANLAMMVADCHEQTNKEESNEQANTEKTGPDRQ